MVNTDEITQFKSEIEASLIEAYGNDITIKTVTEGATDEWGDPATSETSVSTIGVTDQYLITRSNPTQFGRLTDGQMFLIVKGSEVVSKASVITVAGSDYNVLNIEPLQAANIVVAQVLTIGSK